MLRELTTSANKFWSGMALVFALCLVVAPIGCAGTIDEGAGEAATDAAGNAAGGEGPEGGGDEHAGEEAGEHAGGEEGEGGGEHDADDPGSGDADVEVPDRAGEIARDEYSKPQGVYDFLGVGEGDSVVDIAAGSGYNTFLLAERVGSSGRVFAEGFGDGLAVRLESGDLAGASQVELVESLAEIPDGTVDNVVVIRWYHLLPDTAAFVAEVDRILKPGGSVGIVEVRLNQAEGHDMTSHRVGEQTVIADFESGGFTYDGESDILRRDDDDYTLYWGPHGKRYMTDRMLLKFSKAR